MSEPTITCPNCKTEIKLTESLAAPLIESTRRAYEQRLAIKDAEVATREAALREKEQAVAKAQESIDDQVAERLRLERTQIAADENKKARLAFSADLEKQNRDNEELREIIKERDVKLTAAQQAQAEFARKTRELDDTRREMDLTVEKRIREGVTAVREQARKEAEDQLGLKVQEKELTIAAMQRQIEELKRRAEQGSQQQQGEVMELQLESLLASKFPFDTIEPVPKGDHGGDVIQRVVGPNAQGCGTILWESKRTKNWSDGWLTKLREDQRAAKSEIAVIVSRALPKDIETFAPIDGVWVVGPKAALPLAMVLRQSLIELTAARKSAEGQQTKTELVYQYLTGPRFRQRVEAIVESFSSMNEDLHKERKVILKQWAKREEQIERVMQATVGMYGDLQGIAGKTLQEIDGLSLRALASPGDLDGDGR